MFLFCFATYLLSRSYCGDCVQGSMRQVNLRKGDNGGVFYSGSMAELTSKRICFLKHKAGE